MKEQEDGQPATEKQPDFDFEAVYANNSHFEASVWDLKILFGQLEQHTGKSIVDWHTAITIPWMQAKLLDYYLRINIALHEIESGSRININPRVLPSKAGLPPTDDSNAQALYEASVKIYNEMFGES